MKKLIILSALCLASVSLYAKVQINRGDVNISNLTVDRQGNSLDVAFNIDASQLKLKSNQEVRIMPVIANSNNDTFAELPAITIAGRNRVYYHLRNDGDQFAQNVNLFHNGQDASSIQYEATVPYQQWMNLSTLELYYNIGGCANCREEDGFAVEQLASIDMRPAFFEAEYIYTEPVATGVKIRKESGSAYIDFPVNVMTINPDFRNNASELAKISHTIDKVKNDKDYTITSIAIKGFASPEGPYANNERLAKGRTEAVMNYVKSLYTFPKSVKFTTSYDAEDWGGLRKWVAASDLEKKDEILALIDSDLSPDEKDAKIKKDFPVDYPFLLQNVYPSLRHTDYAVNYTVREFTDVQEIVGLVQTAPQKLGLNEFYLAAQTFTPGSDRYNEVFETAVRMYPDDPVANLNAANSEMSKGDFTAAAKYLAKAGNTDAANYARGVYSALTKDYQSALNYFRKAKSIPQATKAIKQVQNCIERPEGKVLLSPVE